MVKFFKNKSDIFDFVRLFWFCDNNILVVKMNLASKSLVEFNFFVKDKFYNMFLVSLSGNSFCQQMLLSMQNFLQRQAVIEARLYNDDIGFQGQKRLVPEK